MLFSSRGRSVPSGRPGEERVPGRAAGDAAPPGAGAQTFSRGSGTSTSNCKLLKFRSGARGRIPGAPGARAGKEPGGDLDGRPGASESCAFVELAPDAPSADGGQGSLASEMSTLNADLQPSRPRECPFESWEVSRKPTRSFWPRAPALEEGIAQRKELEPLICN